ncbi:MAG: SulP family inorganic anion transporter, partial [Proteobacteria bacterium]|nr:SulP family inorganic anion transporter [Pseudomonadota bacterium]
AFFPSSVVHGMLAAIGIIIMAKQIHTLLGVKPAAKTLLGTIAEIPHSLMEFNPEIAFIGIMSLALLIIWSLIKNPTIKMIPAPLLVILMGLALDRYFDLDHIHNYAFLPDTKFLPHHEFSIGPAFLVSVPEHFMAGFSFPDFGKVATLEFWEAVVAIWLVGSLESLLSATAVDKLDPYKRTSNLNRDLTAVGIGNMISGMIGGLPMIAEIVRSSANVNSGAKTAWANFFHGAFLLIFVALFPLLIHEIPLASLAALLVFTGFRLASPKKFANTMEIGLDNFVLFIVTIIILATDLLTGVLIGIAVKLLTHIARGVKLSNLFTMAYHVKQTDENTYHAAISGAAVFSNFMGLKSMLSNLPEHKTIFFDLSEANLIDHTVMEFIHEFSHDYARSGGACEVVGLDAHEPYSDHPLAARRKILAQYEHLDSE